MEAVAGIVASIQRVFVTVLENSMLARPSSSSRYRHDEIPVQVHVIRRKVPFPVPSKALRAWRFP